MEHVEKVVFDLYGTLIYLDNETKPYKRLFSDMGIQTQEEFKEARRIALTENFDNLDDFVKKIKPDANMRVSKYEKEIEKEVKSASFYKETKNVLDELKNRNYSLGIISNLASPYKKPLFDLGLNEYFDEVLFSCDIGLKKPDPRIYRKMTEKFKANPEQSLMTGDRFNDDVKGPESIGMNTVHLDRKNNSPKSISTLNEIFQYL